MSLLPQLNASCSRAGGGDTISSVLFRSGSNYVPPGSRFILPVYRAVNWSVWIVPASILSTPASMRYPPKRRPKECIVRKPGSPVGCVGLGTEIRDGISPAQVLERISELTRTKVISVPKRIGIIADPPKICRCLGLCPGASSASAEKPCPNDDCPRDKGLVWRGGTLYLVFLRC